MYLLTDVLIYLTVAIIAVPVSKKLGLGSVLGYLIAGVIIGPSVLRLQTDVDAILHFSELGVVFLLFIIGLEIQPSRLWVLRRNVFGLGGVQVLLCGLALSVIAWLASLSISAALITGFALALSSTAFVMQLLSERKEMTQRYGRSAFSVLLFQDMAVIPMLALVPILATAGAISMDWQAIGLAIGAIVALILGGQFLLQPLLRIVAGTDIHELLTAVALAVVIGAAVLMYKVGLSMGLGAFIAGMLLADSEYRHQLETDIEPFKGLLLGLFFIAVGMSVNLSLLVEHGLIIAAAVVVLMLTKALIVYVISSRFNMRTMERIRLALILSQGGEFAFVLLTTAVAANALAPAVSEFLIVVISLSMALTPLVMIAADRLESRMEGETATPDFDQIPDEDNDIILASFGRFGQIIGRILSSKGISFTALESDPKQVEMARRFGNKIYFGDARRIDLLRAAGADKARFLILAIEDVETSVATAAIIRQHFPHLKILARARNRVHAHRLMDLGITDPVRDTLHSSLAMCRALLEELGYSSEAAQRSTDTFLEHDERYLRQQHAYHQDEKLLIQNVRQAADELSTLLRRDAEQADEIAAHDEASGDRDSIEKPA
ncbi:MAG: monovalent cation:proton antiporter-2 (CPA2) family protein [Pseudomonadota bacterium]